jgi:hypothetical protein
MTAGEYAWGTRLSGWTQKRRCVENYQLLYLSSHRKPGRMFPDRGCTQREVIRTFRVNVNVNIHTSPDACQG